MDFHGTLVGFEVFTSDPRYRFRLIVSILSFLSFLVRTKLFFLLFSSHFHSYFSFFPCLLHSHWILLIYLLFIWCVLSLSDYVVRRLVNLLKYVSIILYLFCDHDSFEVNHFFWNWNSLHIWKMISFTRASIIVNLFLN